MTHETQKVSLGFWLYLMSDCVLFAALFVTYAVQSSQTFGHATILDIFNLPYVLAETLILLTSSFTVGLAMLFAQQRKVIHTRVTLAVTLALGLAFLGLEVNEFARLIVEGNGPSASAFLSAFFTLLGTHGLHVLVASFWMVVMFAHIQWRGLEESTLRKLSCLALFWHFLDIIWVCIFTFVYLFGSL
jgi:cytochrome o ubiquinol oxidase subunit 3